MRDKTMSETQIYLELDEELQQLLNENGLSVADLLQQEGIEAQIKSGVLPATTETTRTKDLVTVILASSAAVTAISFAISKVLHTLHNKPHFVEYQEPVELRDAQGNVMLDKQGNPLFKMVPRKEFVTPATKDQQQDFEVSFDLPKGSLKIKMSSGEKK
jgi:hypothetical protein